MREGTHEALLCSHLTHARVVVVEKIAAGSAPGSNDDLRGGRRGVILFHGDPLALAGQDTPQEYPERSGSASHGPKHLRELLEAGGDVLTLCPPKLHGEVVQARKGRSELPCIGPPLLASGRPICGSERRDLGGAPGIPLHKRRQ
jgi:hypothetical protein